MEPADEIDRATGCINIQWAKAHEVCSLDQQSVSAEIDPEKCYSVDPAKAILEMASVGPANDAMEMNELTDTWSEIRPRCHKYHGFSNNFTLITIFLRNQKKLSKLNTKLDL